MERIQTLNPRLNAFATVRADQALDQARQAHEDIDADDGAAPSRRPRRHQGLLRYRRHRNNRCVRTVQESRPASGRRQRRAIEGRRRGHPWQDEHAHARDGNHRPGELLRSRTKSLERRLHSRWFLVGLRRCRGCRSLFATLDTDAIGSCRLPAACCGVIGFKGTYGLLSTKGILEGEKADEAILWFSHPGLTTRSVEDAFILLRALADPQRGDALDRYGRHTNEKKVLRVGVAENAKPDAQVEHIFAAAVDALRMLKHEVVKTSAPLEIPGFGDLHAIEVDRQSIADRAFRDIDILVLPTLTGSVLQVDQARGNPQALSPAFTVFANYFGLPALSVPCGFGDDGLPIGLQFVGRPWDDGVVLSLGQQFVAARRFAQHHPIP